MTKPTFLTILTFSCLTSIFANNKYKTYVSDIYRPDSFELVYKNIAAPILIDHSDFSIIHNAAEQLVFDIEKVTNTKSEVYKDKIAGYNKVIIIGSINKSTIIKQLINTHKLNGTELEGKSEKFIIQTILNPFPGIEKALVIAGSDKLGTLYGIYDLSSEIGISPWHWWADIPANRKKDLFILPGIYTKGEPEIKTRGLIWNEKSFEVKNSILNKQEENTEIYYEKIFDLILRLKGNFLSFHSQKIKIQELAKKYGITINNHEARNTNDTVYIHNIQEEFVNNWLKIMYIDNSTDTNSSLPHGNANAWLINSENAVAREFSTEFFFNLAWNFSEFSPRYINTYYEKWVSKIFGTKHANDIVRIIKSFHVKNLLINTRNQKENDYCYTNYNEAEYLLNQYNSLEKDVTYIYHHINVSHKEIYFRIILYPILKNVYENKINIYLKLNKYYADQGRHSTNTSAKIIETIYQQKLDLLKKYNTLIGKTKHHDSVFPGSTSLPAVKTISLPEESKMGVSISNSEEWWPQSDKEATLPVFDIFQKQTYKIEIFNKGSKSFDYKIKSHSPWLVFSSEKGEIKDQDTIHVSIDWQKAPLEDQKTYFIVQGAKEKIKIYVKTKNPENFRPYETDGFVEGNGYISMNATNYSKATSKNTSYWINMNDIGLDNVGITVSNLKDKMDLTDLAKVEYNTVFFNSGLIKIHLLLFFDKGETKGKNSKKIAVSLNDDLKIIDLNKVTIDESSNIYPSIFAEVITTGFYLKEAGNHKLSFWMMDEGIILQKIIIEKEPLKKSFLGPPQSFNKVTNTTIKIK